MSNHEFLHAMICAGLGCIGLVALAISIFRHQFTQDQPDWGSYKQMPARGRLPDMRGSLVIWILISLVSLTAIATLVTVVIASRS